MVIDMAEQHQDRWLRNGDFSVGPSVWVQGRLGKCWNNNKANTRTSQIILLLLPKMIKMK